MCIMESPDWTDAESVTQEPRIRAASAGLDTTERQRTEQELIETRQRLQYLLASSPAVIYSCGPGPDYATTFISDNVERQLGFRPREFYEDPFFWTGQIDKDDAPRVLKELARIETGESISYEYRFRCKDGCYVWLHDEVTPLRDADGRICGIVGSWFDISRRKEAEEALQQSEQKFRLLAENVPGVIYLCRNDERYSMLYLDDRCSELTGYSKEDFLKERLSFVDLYHPEDAPAIFSEVNRALAEKRPFHLQYRIRHRSGELRWIEEFGTGLFDEDSADLLFLEGFLRDVTDRKRLEDQLRQSQKMEALGLLAGGIAHDFNNVLAVIVGNAESLAQQYAIGSHLDDRHRDRVELIISAGERAATLIRQLLAFSRRQTLKPVVLDLNVILADMEAMIRELVGARIALEMRLGEGVFAVRSDAGQIEQIIMNLVVNARDAMPQGGRLTITSEIVSVDRGYVGHHPGARIGRYVVLTVSDTGVGISTDTINRIFEPFFTTKPYGKGTGLGLSTVYGIVRQASGHVDVESKPGAGTTFRVFLPVAEGSPKAAEAVTEDRPASRGTETILVCEDDEDVRRMVCKTLKGAGYQVLSAKNGRQGADVAAGHQVTIHLLLSDVTMPEMDGLELAESLLSQRPQLKALFMTGQSSVALKDVTRHPLRILEKPFHPRLLLSRVRAILDEKF